MQTPLNLPFFQGLRGKGSSCHYGVLLVGSRAGSRVVLTAVAGTELSKDWDSISRSALGTLVDRPEPEGSGCFVKGDCTLEVLG